MAAEGPDARGESLITERIWLIGGRNILPELISRSLGTKRAVCDCGLMSRDNGWLQIVVGYEELSSLTSLQLHVRIRPPYQGVFNPNADPIKAYIKMSLAFMLTGIQLGFTVK